jgi:hypothetical protein
MVATADARQLALLADESYQACPALYP